MKTILSGSLAYDRIMEFPEFFSDHILPDKLKEINVCFMVDGVTENFGGTAGNIGYALKLMGGDPQLTATIGMDSQRYTEWLTKNNISTAGIVKIEDEWTAGAYITTDKANNQITNFNPGAMKFSSQLDMTSLSQDDIVIVSPGNLDDMVNYPAQCRKTGVRYIFDPGQALPVLGSADLLSCIDGCMLLMVNDYEMGLIMSKTDLSQEEIIDRAGSVIITRGGEGSTLFDRKTSTVIPVVKANNVADPTGAGDAYRGGLLYGLVQGKSLQDCCLLGSTCASFAVECNGTQVYSFTKDEFEARFKTA